MSTAPSRYPSLFVVSRFRLHLGPGSRCGQVGREFGVRYWSKAVCAKTAIECAYRAGRAESGKYVWAEYEDRDLADMLRCRTKLLRR